MRTFGTPWPASGSIMSIVEPVVHLQEELNCCRIGDSQSRSMPVLKMVDEPLSRAPIVNGIHRS